MKRILLVLFALISLNAFSQLQVKEGSFKHIPGGIIEDKLEYTDGNDFPMALIKISTENIVDAGITITVERELAESMTIKLCIDDGFGQRVIQTGIKQNLG